MLFNRGQPPAWQTKVVDSHLCPLKSGGTCLCVLVCANALKSASVGRGASAQTNNNATCDVCVCGSVHCKTSKHISQGSSFMSNVTWKCYSVVSPNSSMDCTTKNIIYLITCKKCGIQYVGGTSQRLKNHRNRLTTFTNLYLYHHFTLDGHSEDDVSIMPIEEITTSDRVSASAKWLEREDYWCRELCTFYTYGLNDKVRNISKCKDELVINTLFNEQQRKFRKRKCWKRGKT